ncbi:uncharacterized protein [Littorina saxatilis]|uniref:uncharacterized protein isoform X2 n=1 Tax=Littorina saxatilis TaxID=31220 RepID=UPI0038B52982
MADIGDSEGDLADVRLLFHNYSLRHKTRNTAQVCVYVGESLRYDVVITKPKEILFKDWQRRVSQLSAHACVSPIEKGTGGEKQSSRKPQPQEKDDAVLCTEGENQSSRKPQPQEKDDAVLCTEGENQSSRKPQPQEKDDAVLCSVLTTYIDTVEKKTFAGAGSIQKEKLYFQEGSSCVIPMSTCVGNTAGQGQRAELCVTLWLSTTTQLTPSSNPKFHASDDKFHDVKFHADDAKFQDDESNMQCNTGTSSLTPTAGRKCVEHKTVTRPLRVRDPPYLKVQFVSCGQQHLLLVQVHNGTGQTVTLKNLTIVPSSSASSDPREFFSSSFGHGHRDRCGGPDSWQQVVSLALSGGSVFPVMLAGCEQLALIYRLDLSAITSPVELAFHSYLRWTHPDTNKEITTVFRLPRLRVRYPAFTVTVKCEGPVETGKTFYLTYNIANNLQDFLSVRLYWSLDSQLASLSATGSPDTDQERSKLEAVKRSIICHDPDIFIGYSHRHQLSYLLLWFQVFWCCASLCLPCSLQVVSKRVQPAGQCWLPDSAARTL